MNPNTFRKLILVLVVAVLLVSACGEADATGTPTEPSLDAIYTLAAATVFAGQTGTAGARPTQTLTPTATITPTGTITPTLAPSQAVYVPKVVYAATSTTTGTPGTGTPSITPTYGAVGCNNAAFIQDVTIPSNTKLSPGEKFTKTWRIKNTGTCGWTAGYKFTFIGGELFGSDTRKIRSTVGVGGTLDISLSMVAPSSPGTYSSYWRMADESGQLFGTAFSAVIIIPGATYTPTPVTATPNANQTAAAATANANAVASAVAGTAAANANATANANAVASAVAATQTKTAIDAANAAATQAAIDAANAANAAATQAAIDAANAAATQAAIDAANAAATQAAEAATQAAAASETAAAQPPSP